MYWVRARGDGLSSGASEAKTLTLHYFSKQASSTFTDAARHPLSQTAAPAAGDVFDTTDLDYVGNPHAPREALDCLGSPQVRLTSSAQAKVRRSGCHRRLDAARERDPSELRSQSAGVCSQWRYRCLPRRTRTLKSVDVGKTNNSDFTIRVTV